MCLTKTPNPPPVPTMPVQPTEADAQQSLQAAKIKRQQQAMSGYQGAVLSGAGGKVGDTKPILGG